MLSFIWWICLLLECMLSVDGNSDAPAEAARVWNGWNKFRRLAPLLINNDVSLLTKAIKTLCAKLVCATDCSKWRQLKTLDNSIRIGSESGNVFLLTVNRVILRLLNGCCFCCCSVWPGQSSRSSASLSVSTVGPQDAGPKLTRLVARSVGV